MRTGETAYKADDTSLTTSPASDKTSNFTSDAAGMIPMTNLFEVSTRRVSDDYRIECSGELDISTVDKLEDAIDNCFSDDAPASLLVCSSPLVDVPGQREGSRGQATQGGGYEAHSVDINYPAENGWEHLESG